MIDLGPEFAHIDETIRVLIEGDDSTGDINVDLHLILGDTTVQRVTYGSLSSAFAAIAVMAWHRENGQDSLFRDGNDFLQAFDAFAGRF